MLCFHNQKMFAFLGGLSQCVHARDSTWLGIASHKSHMPSQSHATSRKSRSGPVFALGWHYQNPKNVFMWPFLFPNNSGFFHTRLYFDKKIFWLVSRNIKTFPNAPYKRSTTMVVLPYNAGKWLSFCTRKRHWGDIDSDTLCGKSLRHRNPGRLPSLHPPSKWYSRALLAGSPDTQDRRV